MEWKNNGQTEFCKESYTFNENLGTSYSSSINVCLKPEGFVQIVYFNKFVTERLVMGIDEDENCTILENYMFFNEKNRSDESVLSIIPTKMRDSDITELSKIIENDRNPISRNFDKFYDLIDSGTVPSNIYGYHKDLLDIPSDEILRIISNFATNDIEKMEKQK